VQFIISGILVGTAYAVLAIGFCLIWGAARIVYLTYTAFYMLTAYFFYVLCTLIGLNIFLAALLSIIISTLIGIATYRLCIERIRGHETIVILVSIALAFFFEEGIRSIFGSLFRRVPPFISGYQELLGVRVLNQYILAFGVNLALIIGLWLFLSKSKIGLAIRATSQDREIVSLMGISEKKVSAVAVTLGIGLGTVSSVMVAPIYVVEPAMWVPPIAMVLAIVVLGGLGSLKGSLIAAYILGFSECAVVSYLPIGTFVKGAVALLVMIVILFLRPEGMFGVNFEEERL